MTRRLVVGLMLATVVIVGVIVYANRGYSGYSVRVILADAGGLQGGSNVSVGGVAVGSVASLSVDKQDRAVAVLHINSSVAPVGLGATAEVQIDGFFGEREMLLTRGAYATHPEPSGYTIPVAASSVSVRLDDVVDALDMDAQGGLRTFLDEQGKALVGRGQSLAAVLAQLPQTLPSLTQLLSQLSANQQALGALVDHSDRVVAQVAAQRAALRQLINSGNGALSALASRRDQLGETVRTAPATLRQAQLTLATLQGAAIPLSPAADGLRATAPSLTAALQEIPRFAIAAVPTLNEVATIAPALQRLSDQATPVVRALVPLTNRLTSYSSQALTPVTSMLADKGGAANLFGLMEGWARSTQGYDASSHIFRFGATLSAASFTQLLSMLSLPGLPPLHRSQASTAAAPSGALAPAASSAGSAVASSGGNSLPSQPTAVGGALAGTVNGALGALHNAAAGLLGRLSGGGSGGSGSSGSGSGGSGGQLSSLLSYLLGK